MKFFVISTVGFFLLVGSIRADEVSRYDVCVGPNLSMWSFKLRSQTCYEVDNGVRSVSNHTEIQTPLGGGKHSTAWNIDSKKPATPPKSRKQQPEEPTWPGKLPSQRARI